VREGRGEQGGNRWRRQQWAGAVTVAAQAAGLCHVCTQTASLTGRTLPGHALLLQLSEGQQ
jgi:hypothetical protein